ncbi:MAG TPA: hypothetical protein VII00_06605 [bacterium]
MKYKPSLFILFTLLLVLGLIVHSYAQEEEFLTEETITEELLPFEEDQPAGELPAEELPATAQEETEETLPAEEIPVAAPEEIFPAAEIPVVEPELAPLEAAPQPEAPAKAASTSEEIPLQELPPAAPAAPPAVQAVQPVPSALTEDEMKATSAPEKKSAMLEGMIPVPIPGTFMKRSQGQISTSFKYDVQSGDDLHFLAARFYGNARLWEKIYNANKNIIGKNPSKLEKGMILTIPSQE